jgi:ABC-type uncharacterized transport system permease subunit
VSSLSSVLVGLALVAYFISAALYLANLHVRHGHFARYAAVAAVLGFLSQSIRIGIVAAHGISPFATPFESLVLVSWAVAALYLIILWLYRLPTVGALEMPLAFLCMLLAIAHRNVVSAVKLSGWMEIHVIGIVISMAALLLAFCCSVLFLVQNKLLKSKKLKGMFRRLPSLELTDSLAHHLVAIGFPLLTLGIITGIVGVHSGLVSRGISSTKIIAAAVTWATYGLYLLSYGALGWRGKRVHYILIVGALAVTLTAALHGLG